MRKAYLSRLFRSRLLIGYLAGEFLISFLVAFLFFFFIFFVNQLLLMAEEIFAKRVPVGEVLLMVLFSLPSIVALAFPFGALLGALMAVGRMSSDNEVLALRALGVPLRRLFLPFIFLGILLSLVSFVINDYFLPLGNLQLARTYRKVLYSNPAVELESYSVKRTENTTLVTGMVNGRSIDRIVIVEKKKENRKEVITASRASLEEERGGRSPERSGGRGILQLRLEEAFRLQPSGEASYEYTSAERMFYTVLLQDLAPSFVNPGPREMSSVDVYRQIRVMEKDLDERRKERKLETEKAWVALLEEMRILKDFWESGPLPPKGLKELENAYSLYMQERDRRITNRTHRLFLLEFHKKFSIPLACLVFIAFAFPAGLLARRSGRTVGFGIGLLVSSLYWGLLFVGQTLGLRLDLDPALAMWSPDLIILLLGGIIYTAGRLR